jgi:hypothetical protein
MAPAVTQTPRDLAHSQRNHGGETVDTQSIRPNSPEVLPDEEAPHGCYEGFVYIGTSLRMSKASP